MESTGYILAAAGIVAVNEALFVPVLHNQPVWKNFNWRLIPATAVAGFTLAGLEKLSPPLGKGLAILALLSVLLYPVGNAPTPLENAARFLGIEVK